MNLRATAQTGGETGVSPGWLVIYGFVLMVLGVVGICSSVASRPLSRRLARRNGVSAAAIGLVGIVMIVIGVVQML